MERVQQEALPVLARESAGSAGSCRYVE